MGVSVHITGYVPPDEEWQKKKAAYVALKDAGLEIPDELREFFNYEDPTDLDGMVVNIEDAITGQPEYGDGGALIEVAKLPDSIKYIRVSMG